MNFNFLKKLGLRLDLAVLLAMFLSSIYGARANELSLSSPLTPPTPIETKSLFQQYVKINLKDLSGYLKSDRARFTRIAGNTEKIINSEELRDSMLSHVVVPFKPVTPGFYDVNGMLAMSAEQAFQITMAKDWDLVYRTYCRYATSVVGYTYATVEWITLNQCYKNFKVDSLVAQNICHEYGGHKRGFRHSMNWDKFRDYSYPYAFGRICQQLYVKQFKPWKKP